MSSLRGKLPKGTQHLTPSELDALRQEGLLGDRGAPKEEAFQQPDLTSKACKAGVTDVRKYPELANKINQQLEACEENPTKLGPPPEFPDEESELPTPPPPKEEEATGIFAEKESVPPPPPPPEGGDDELDPVEHYMGPDLERCPRCLQDLNAKWREPVISDEDKKNFVRHVLSTDSDKGRFYKEYECLDGSVKIRFRSRTTDEERAMFDLLYYWRNGENIQSSEKIDNDADFYLKMERLGMILSLDRIIREDSTENFPLVSQVTIRQEIKELSDLPAKLHYADKLIMSNKHAALVNILMVLYKDFNRLYNVLTLRAPKPDFFRPTPGSD